MELSAFRNLFGDLQEYVCSILNQDELLSAMGAEFYSENSLDIEYQVKTALAKTGLACLVLTPRATYQGHNGIQQTFTCDELTLQIVENPVVNRPRLKRDNLDHGTAMDIAKQASDRLAGPQGGYFGKFTTKRIQEAEQSGLLVVTATFGCTVYETLSAVISGDLSGNWVEVPFVRMSELSDWIDDYLSTHVPVPEVSGYLPLSGGMMTGAISAYSNATTIDWGYDGSLAAGTPGVEIRTAGEDGYYRLPAQDGSGGPSEYDVMRRKDLPSVDVPTKISELSNDVGYITSAQVVPGEVYSESLSGYALMAWYSNSILPVISAGATYAALKQNAGHLYLLYNNRLEAVFNIPYDWSLSSFQGTQFSPPVTMTYSWWPNKVVRVGHRVQNISRGWGWNGAYDNTEYFIQTAESISSGFNLPTSATPTRFYTFVGTTYTSKPITLTENQLSIDTYDGQTGVIECSRLSTGWIEKHNAIPYVDEVVPYNNTSALTVTVPYDYGFTLQTPNGIPLIQTIDLNRTSINSLSAGNAEIGPDGYLVKYPGAGVDTTKLSAWQWLKTGETGIGGIISSEHNAILGEVAEDYVAYNWLIQQGYITSADISSLTGAYLPLSGGQMSGGISWDYGGLGGPKIYGPYNPQQLLFQTTYAPDAGKAVLLDFGAISEADGQRTIAYAEDVWGKDSATLSVGTGGYKTDVDPGAVTIQHLNNGTLTKTMYNWDGLTYTISAEGGLPANYNLAYPLSGGTIATRQYVDAYLGDISALIHES